MFFHATLTANPINIVRMLVRRLRCIRRYNAR